MPIGSGMEPTHEPEAPFQNVPTINPAYLKNARAPRLNASAHANTARRRLSVVPRRMSTSAAQALSPVESASKGTSHGVCQP